MIFSQHFVLEGHQRSATLYLNGAISVAGLLEAMRRCDALPPSIWLLRVELSTNQPLDAGTQTVLTHALHRWRDTRSGMTHITVPLSPAMRSQSWRARRCLATMTR